MIPMIGSRIVNMKRFEGLLLKPIKAVGAPHFTHPGTRPPDGRSSRRPLPIFLFEAETRKALCPFTHGADDPLGEIRREPEAIASGNIEQVLASVGTQGTSRMKELSDAPDQTCVHQQRPN